MKTPDELVRGAMERAEQQDKENRLRAVRIGKYIDATKAWLAVMCLDVPELIDVSVGLLVTFAVRSGVDIEKLVEHIKGAHADLKRHHDAQVNGKKQQGPSRIISPS